MSARRHFVWEIFRVANAAEERRRQIHQRRQERRILRDRSDPLQYMGETEFIKTYRLDKASVLNLANDLGTLIRQERRRDGISVILKILITLSFCATGSYQTLVGQSSSHNVAQTTVSKAVRQVTNAINTPRYFRRYVKWPMAVQERNRLKAKFYQKFGIPGVLGCIDGTHVAIIRPEVHEERYINRKGYHSLNVMIICDANLNILAVDASSPGSAHDSIVWNSHPLSTHLNELSNNGENLFLLGDIRKTMMTPILNTLEGTPDNHYYKKHVTARNTVERCIGVLKERFRCLLMARALHYNPVTAGKIVNACAVFHNIAVENNLAIPTPTAEEAAREIILQEELETGFAEEVLAFAATGQAGSRRVNPDLQEGRDLQQIIVQNLWREREDRIN